MLVVKMAEAGHTLLEKSPYSAMQSIAWRAKRSTLDRLADLDEAA